MRLQPWIEPIEFVMSNEGGYADIASDPGGATNFGISTRFLRSLPEENLKRYGLFLTGDAITPQVIRDLTSDQAKLIYKCEFWDGKRFDEVTGGHVRIYLFDCCVNHGHGRGVGLLQRALRANGSNEILDDGILGDDTLNAVAGTLGDIELTSGLKSAFIATRAQFMHCTAMARNNYDILDGWLKRAYRWP
jgi:lysozyme family protein